MRPNQQRRTPLLLLLGLACATVGLTGCPEKDQPSLDGDHGNPNEVEQDPGSGTGSTDGDVGPELTTDETTPEPDTDAEGGQPPDSVDGESTEPGDDPPDDTDTDVSELLAESRALWDALVAQHGDDFQLTTWTGEDGLVADESGHRLVVTVENGMVVSRTLFDPENQQVWGEVDDTLGWHDGLLPAQTMDAMHDGCELGVDTAAAEPDLFVLLFDAHPTTGLMHRCQLLEQGCEVDCGPSVQVDEVLFTNLPEISPDDADGDGLLDDEETALGTNPLNQDTDHDGIPDGWEALNLNGCELAPLGCDPLRKDLLIEVDYHLYEVDGELLSARLSPTVVEALETYYANLAIPNPNANAPIAGAQGIRLQLIFDDAHPLGKGDGVKGGEKNVAHDCYVGDGTTGDLSSSDFPVQTFRKATVCFGAPKGNGHIGGRTFKFRMPKHNGDPNDDIDETAHFHAYRLFMHELGHNLGLLHGGRQNANKKPNYPSVMNYRYDDKLYVADALNLSKTHIGYSTGALADFPLNQCALDELNSFPGFSVADVKFLKKSWTVEFNGVDGPKIDWDKEGDDDPLPYPLELVEISTFDNCSEPGGQSMLYDYDDRVVIEHCMSIGLKNNVTNVPNWCP